MKLIWCSERVDESSRNHLVHTTSHVSMHSKGALPPRHCQCLKSFWCPAQAARPPALDLSPRLPRAAKVALAEELVTSTLHSHQLLPGVLLQPRQPAWMEDLGPHRPLQYHPVHPLLYTLGQCRPGPPHSTGHRQQNSCSPGSLPLMGLAPVSHWQLTMIGSTCPTISMTACWHLVQCMPRPLMQLLLAQSQLMRRHLNHQMHLEACPRIRFQGLMS